MHIPTLQIQQYPAVIEVSTQWGTMEQRQPGPEVSMHTEQPKLSMEQAQLHLELDTSKGREGLTGGTIFEMKNRIYSQMPELLLQVIAKKVQDGNQLADITNPGNTIANIIGSQWNDYPKLEYLGQATSANVDMRFVLKPLQMEVQAGSVSFDVQVNRPELDYTPGRVNIQVKQYSRVEITPPPLVDERL